MLKTITISNKNKSVFYLMITHLLLSQSAWADFKDIPIVQTDAPSTSQQGHGVKSTTNKQLKKTKTTAKSDQKTQSTKTNQTPDVNAVNNDLSQHNSDAPVFFVGDKGDVSKQTGIINLDGNVDISQDNTTLTSDKAQIITQHGSVPLSGSTSIQKAIATGNVNVHKKSTSSTPEINAKADQLEFLVPQHTMVLKGKARVKKGQEFVNADTIIINLVTGDIHLEQPHGTIDPRTRTSSNK